MSVLRLAVLASGRGSNLQSILDAARCGELDASVRVVLSDVEGAFALERARTANIPCVWVNPKAYQHKAEYEEELLHIIKGYHIDCIVLAGYMRVLTPHFIRGAGVPIVNIHPSLLPSFPGLHAQRQALEYGVRYSGCTVHFVDEGVDSGPVILQAVVSVMPGDTEDSLAARILAEEHRIYPRALQLISAGRVARQGRRVLILEGGMEDEQACLDQRF